MAAFRELFLEALTSLLVIYLAETFVKVCLFLISRVVYDLSVRRGLFSDRTHHIGFHLSTFTDLWAFDFLKIIVQIPRYPGQNAV